MPREPVETKLLARNSAALSCGLSNQDSAALTAFSKNFQRAQAARSMFAVPRHRHNGSYARFSWSPRDRRAPFPASASRGCAEASIGAVQGHLPVRALQRRRPLQAIAGHRLGMRKKSFRQPRPNNSIINLFASRFSLIELHSISESRLPVVRSIHRSTARHSPTFA
jgi:hypothetical protein